MTRFPISYWLHHHLCSYLSYVTQPQTCLSNIISRYIHECICIVKNARSDLKGALQLKHSHFARIQSRQDHPNNCCRVLSANGQHFTLGLQLYTQSTETASCVITHHKGIYHRSTRIQDWKASRTVSLGLGNSILRSIRPGRSRAGSRISMRFVAISTFQRGMQTGATPSEKWDGGTKATSGHAARAYQIA